MKAIIRKWGNSLGIRIPAIYAKELELTYGSTVNIEKDDDAIVIRPPKNMLENLLAQVSEKNKHDSIDTGDPRGKESW
ncbi:MAG TPA: AbrB/MazE/SpoVT family DNA-binding domain-containing protein [Rectinema sp.]|jgi:antitoxin MazE|nr:AbrB/MazE/SpoVT family DNA-binding domain-containing protein [Rectinema sp.]HQL17305.1 AbrB/MazE/SpoVT family DNA-binding domain-containing protein [Rectinema sp.]